MALSVQRLELPARPAAAGDARRFVEDVLARAGADGATDVGVLLTSELVTNAVLYAQGTIEVQVRAGSGRVRVSVGDQSSAEPRPRHVAPDASSGRGLALVESLAERWGVERQADDGKRVWFELSC